MKKEFISVGRCVHCTKYIKLTMGTRQPWKETPISAEEATAMVLQGSRSKWRVCRVCWWLAGKI
jgi:hypothetical protein